MKRIEKKKVTKTIVSLTGEKIKRQGELTVELPESNEEAVSLFGENLWKWARHGYFQHARISASNQLIGAAGNKETKKLLRQFRQSLDTLVNVMEMAKEDAIAKLLGKEMFSAVAQHFEGMKNATETVSIDFTTDSISLPRWFEKPEEDEGEDDDEDESEGE